MKKLVILNRIKEDKLAALRAMAPDCEVEAYAKIADALPHLADADAVALWGFQDPLPVLNAAPKLRWLHSLSAGIEALLPPAMYERDIILTHTAGVHDQPVAETAIAMLLALAHHFPAALAAQQAGEWERIPFAPLAGQTILIAGFGGIGRAAARMAKGLGMNVIACKRNPMPAAEADEVISQDQILDHIGRADAVLAALPGTPETEQFFRAEHFAAMKNTAFFINIARGSLVDQDALTAALRNQEIAGAGLDVFTTEPLPADHPLRHTENVIITAHSAAMVHHYFDKVLALLGENWRRFLQGEELLHVVDKERRY